MATNLNISTLNKPQKQAVTLGKQNSLILAGAGSGKTCVLTYRIAYVCKKEQISPLNILAVTFTNKAAKEVQERVAELLAFSTYGMWIGTFHGIANRLLRKHGAEIGIDKNFRILDQDEQLQIIKQILKGLNLDDKKYPPKYVQNFINKKKDDCLRSNDIGESSYYDSTFIKIYQAYEMRLKADNAMDFADLLLYVYELFAENEIIRNYYKKYFKYILVDEFQDTNKVQYMWLKLLVSDDNCIMAVGDDDQSIYGWRGAKVENIISYTKELNNVKVIKLEQNYRSSQNILNAANALIAHNSNRMGKDLWSSGDTGSKIDLYSAINERMEAKFVCNEIKNLYSQDVNYSDIAILYRSNYQSRVLEESAIYTNIPYRIYGGTKFFDREEVKDALAYMRLASFFSDNLAFMRVVNKPTRGIGAKSVETIRNYAEINDLSLWEASNQIIIRALLPKRATMMLANFQNIILNISEKIHTLSLTDFMSFAIKESGLFEKYETKTTEKDRQKLENLKELINATADFEPSVDVDDDSGEAILHDFLSFAVLESGEMQADEESDSIQMMTIHAAKGLEFPYVFVVGLEEGVFPPSSVLNIELSTMQKTGNKVMMEKIFEERRLFYVAITRAMKHLSICYANVRSIFGRTSLQMPSRFINEIPDKYLNKIQGKKPAHSTPQYKGKKIINKGATQFGISPFDFLKTTNKDSFVKGDTVIHKVFGEGIFVLSEKKGNKMSYVEDFYNVGRKTLLQSLANLTKI